jgi:hypothetical protein
MLPSQLAPLSSIFCLTAVNDPKEADIIWVGMQVDSEVKKALGLRDQQYTNQFPFEACLVMKHHLAETIHKVIYQISVAFFVLFVFQKTLHLKLR